MTTQETKVQVGTVMIYRKDYGEAPLTVNVSKVTKAGWIRFTMPNGKDSDLYKAAYEGCYEQTGEKRWNTGKLFLYSEERWAELNNAHLEAERVRNEKRAAEQKRQQEIAAREAQELDEVKARLGGNYLTATRMQDRLPNGDKFLVITLPMKPENIDYRGEYQLVTIRVGQEKDWNCDQVWVAYHTYTEKRSGSFSSCSGTRGATEEEVIWKVLAYQYR